MITNITTTTPSIQGSPCGFGMPEFGAAAAFGTPVTGQWSVDLRTSVIVRDRAAVATKGHLGLIAYVPGSRAWSPPV